MYIQKRDDSYYLKSSQWDAKQQKTVSMSQYLGRDVDSAIKKLEEFVTYDFVVMKEKLLIVAAKPPDKLKDIKRLITKAHKLSNDIDNEEIKIAINDLMDLLKKESH